MSDIAADVTSLNIAELVARIERQQEETRKFVSEQHKLTAEANKLLAEGRKFNRDPWFIVVGAIIAGLATRLPEILRVFGVGH